ncbi:MAG: helix-turn-helix domain-containing protein [Patescibacteria group bacterium]
MSGVADKILNAEQIAKFFGVSRKTVWEWCKHGKLPAFKIGKEWKIRQSDLQRMMNQKVKSEKSEKGLF